MSTKPKEGTYDPSNPPFVSTYKSMSGYKAVVYWHNPDMGGFTEPWDTGKGTFARIQDAENEAQQLAISLNLKYMEEV